MKKIIISFFMIFSFSLLAEEDITSNSKKIYEFRPEILIKLDKEIANPLNRGNLKNLFAEYDMELKNYLESVNYDSDTIFFLGNEYILLNNYERANKIFILDNKDFKNIFAAATTYRFMGKNEEAIQKYNEAISLNSAFAESYLGRALTNRNLDNYDSAINDLRTYISMTSSVEGYIALGDIYFQLGRNNDAMNIVSEGLAKYPNSNLLRLLAFNISQNGKESN